MRSPRELTDRFRQRGLRITPQRERIFRVLFETSSHPTADVVYEAVRKDMPSISLRTVYETLNELVELGEIQAFDLGMGARRFDPNTDTHHHLICVRCGLVRDVAADSSQIQIPAEHEHGFSVRSTEVSYRGVCATCARDHDST